ncbi:aminotransferase class V-fold PLP-dependent enzyme [Schnuerera sp. xch1]|uniref:aminotransferase class V-fold PLP-dependent enzyme n=1 Tax=Schnuerera sp. xch1 TaxID=2874283 RepID=UPI001CBADAFE|nr:aminotransferase class V-fold PLP-dependent enzyme [Schnuerera sp. xch1]MBZ2175807.1 aminotransferase class V-fold PLP-dependent enzyme [Schnuerera sp. xch1]
MYKKLIHGVNTLVPIENNTKVPYINFDNAATTPPLSSVINGINNFAPFYSSIHRGTGYKSIISSLFYDQSRDKVLNFVKANPDFHTVIFVKNTTEAINKLSYRLKDQIKDGIVLSTYMEHHSNDLPWRYKYNVDYVDVDENGRLSLDHLEYLFKKYKGKVKLLAITGASNVTGYINPIHKIAKMAHKHGSKILVDGAQLVPHHPVDMKTLEDPAHIDFLAFSSHKMYAPFGIGILIAPKDIFKNGFSEHIGGGTVDLVTHKEVIWAPPPEKEEAGTPNLFGVVALIESIKTLKKLDMGKIADYERSLTKYTLEKLKTVPNIIIYDDEDVKNKVSIISFNIDGLYHGTVATALSLEGGIGVRNGCFCAQPYIQKLLNVPSEHIEEYKKDKNIPRPGTVRLSYGMYNDYKEINILIELLKQISNNIDYYHSKYKNPPSY